MDGRLDALDALASILLMRAAPVQFDRAESAATREAAYRLRFATVVEEGWATAVQFPEWNSSAKNSTNESATSWGDTATD